MSKLIVERLAVEFGFNVEEAMACLKTKVKVPFVKVIEGQCDGLKMNGGLFTQCTNKPMATGELCKTCQKQADASGKPTCGLASEREAEGEAWRDPKGRAPVAFGKVMQKEGLNQEVVEREMTRLFGKGDYSALFAMPEKKTTKKAKKEDGEKKQRGRPKKNKEVVSLAEGDDLISTLIAQARTESNGAQKVAAEESTEKPVEEETNEEPVEAPAAAEKPKKVKKAKLTEEEKAAAKQARANARAAAKEEAKKEKAAEKAAAKEAAKKAKADARAAAKEEAKQAKAVEKAAAKEAKAAEKKTTKKTKKAEAVEEPAAPVEELTADSPVEEVQVRQVTLGDVEYLMDQEKTVYDLATQEPIGVWDEATQTIKEEEME
jgi:chemotaxis protein histidine kinase CheA